MEMMTNGYPRPTVSQEKMLYAKFTDWFDRNLEEDLNHVSALRLGKFSLSIVVKLLYSPKT